jgi:hypothetical protein
MQPPKRFDKAHPGATVEWPDLDGLRLGAAARPAVPAHGKPAPGGLDDVVLAVLDLRGEGTPVGLGEGEDRAAGVLAVADLHGAGGVAGLVVRSSAGWPGGLGWLAQRAGEGVSP